MITSALTVKREVRFHSFESSVLSWCQTPAVTLLAPRTLNTSLECRESRFYPRDWVSQFGDFIPNSRLSKSNYQPLCPDPCIQLNCRHLCLLFKFIFSLIQYILSYCVTAHTFFKLLQILCVNMYVLRGWGREFAMWVWHECTFLSLQINEIPVMDFWTLWRGRQQEWTRSSLLALKSYN